MCSFLYVETYWQLLSSHQCFHCPCRKANVWCYKISVFSFTTFIFGRRSGLVLCSGPFKQLGILNCTLRLHFHVFLITPMYQYNLALPHRIQNASIKHSYSPIPVPRRGVNDNKLRVSSLKTFHGSSQCMCVVGEGAHYSGY